MWGGHTWQVQSVSLSWGCGAEPLVGPGAPGPWRKAPEAENLIAFGCLIEAANLLHSPYFANFIHPRYL